MSSGPYSSKSGSTIFTVGSDTTQMKVLSTLMRCSRMGTLSPLSGMAPIDTKREVGDSPSGVFGRTEVSTDSSRSRTNFSFRANWAPCAGCSDAGRWSR